MGPCDYQVNLQILVISLFGRMLFYGLRQSLIFSIVLHLVFLINNFIILYVKMFSYLKRGQMKRDTYIQITIILHALT